MPRCSLATSNFCFPSATILRPNVSGSCSDMFLRQSALNPHMSFWWFLSSNVNRVTPIQVQKVTCLHPVIIDGLLVKYINAGFGLSLDINVILRNREIVIRSVVLGAK